MDNEYSGYSGNVGPSLSAMYPGYYQHHFQSNYPAAPYMPKYEDPPGDKQPFVKTEEMMPNNCRTPQAIESLYHHQRQSALHHGYETPVSSRMPVMPPFLGGGGGENGASLIGGPAARWLSMTRDFTVGTPPGSTTNPPAAPGHHILSANSSINSPEDYADITTTPLRGGYAARKCGVGGGADNARRVCVVCGDSASGIHYKVNCANCKEFGFYHVCHVYH